MLLTFSNIFLAVQDFGGLIFITNGLESQNYFNPQFFHHDMLFKLCYWSAYITVCAEVTFG